MRIPKNRFVLSITHSSRLMWLAFVLVIWSLTPFRWFLISQWNMATLQRNVREYALPQSNELDNTAARYPHDFDARLTAAVYTGANPENRQDTPGIRSSQSLEGHQAFMKKLRTLCRDFQDKPQNFAALLRHSSVIEIRQPEKPNPDLRSDDHGRRRVGYSQPELEELVGFAKEGAALAPDNAFFPMMHAHYLFGLGRNEEALNAVVKASSCRVFDDYVGETEEAQRRSMRQLTGCSGYLAKWHLLGAPETWHESALRSTSRAVTWAATQAATVDGREERALQWSESLMRVGALMMTSPSSTNTNMSGWAVASIAIGALVPEGQLSKQNTKRTPEESRESYLRVAIQTAKRVGGAEHGTWVSGIIKMTDDSIQRSRAINWTEDLNGEEIVYQTVGIGFIPVICSLLAGLTGLTTYLAARVVKLTESVVAGYGVVFVALVSMTYYAVQAARQAFQAVKPTMDYSAPVSSPEIPESWWVVITAVMVAGPVLVAAVWSVRTRKCLKKSPGEFERVRGVRVVLPVICISTVWLCALTTSAVLDWRLGQEFELRENRHREGLAGQVVTVPNMPPLSERRNDEVPTMFGDPVGQRK